VRKQYPPILGNDLDQSARSSPARILRQVQRPRSASRGIHHYRLRCRTPSQHHVRRLARGAGIVSISSSCAAPCRRTRPSLASRAYNRLRLVVEEAVSYVLRQHSAAPPRNLPASDTSRTAGRDLVTRLSVHCAERMVPQQLHGFVCSRGRCAGTCVQPTQDF